MAKATIARPTGRALRPPVGGRPVAPRASVEPNTDAPPDGDGTTERATTFSRGTGVAALDPSPHDSHASLCMTAPTPGAAQLHTPVGSAWRSWFSCAADSSG